MVIISHRFSPFSTSCRVMEQSSSRSEPLGSSLLAQVEVEACSPLLDAPPTSAVQPQPLSPAPQHQQWERELRPDREHPLTRLELALAEVQQCSGSESVPVRIHDNGSTTEAGRGPTRSLSVLEKVSRFERRERAGKQRSHSTCASANSVVHLRVTQKPRLIGSHTSKRTTVALKPSRPLLFTAVCSFQATEQGRSITGAEDLRNMLERSSGGAKAHRTMSYRGGSSEHMRHRYRRCGCLLLGLSPLRIS